MVSDRRARSPLLAACAVMFCLSVWQLIGCPGPPPSAPIYELLSPMNATDDQTVWSSYLSPTDYTTLMNLAEFRFLLLAPVCGNSTSPLLLVLVHSAPGNIAKRRAIRDTWGSIKNDLKIVFFVGRVRSQKMQSRINYEQHIHGDITQGNFIDAYRNMTYKHVMALKYAVYHCPKAKYVLKTDDDVFVNTPTMLGFLGNELSMWGARKLLMCDPLSHSVVKRTYRSKWRVSFSEFREKYYPTYCPGWVLLYSNDVALQLYLEAQKAKYFWIDDVLITGVIARKLGLVHTPVGSLVLKRAHVRALVVAGAAGKLANDEAIRASALGTPYAENKAAVAMATAQTTAENAPDPGSFLYGSPNLPIEDIYGLWAAVSKYVPHHRSL